MTWTKKDFIALARIIGDSEGESDLIDGIIWLCKVNNPRFDEGKFMNLIEETRDCKLKMREKGV